MGGPCPSPMLGTSACKVSRMPSTLRLFFAISIAGFAVITDAVAAQSTPMPVVPGGPGPFEGIIDVRIESAALKAPQVLTIEVDTPRHMIRFDLERSENVQQEVHGILDTAHHKLTLVRDATRTTWIA